MPTKPSCSTSLKTSIDNLPVVYTRGCRKGMNIRKRQPKEGMRSRCAKGLLHPRKQAINQDDAIDDERYADILPGAPAEHHYEVEYEIEDDDDHQEEPCFRPDPPEHLSKPGVHPDHQAPHEGIKEVESPQGNRANKERDDPQELQRIDSSQDGQDSSQDSENGDAYGTLVHGRTPLNNRSVEISSS